MRWTVRRALTGRKPFSLFAAFSVAAVFAVVLGVPADGGTAAATERTGLPDGKSAASSQTGQSFGGVAAVGALFGYSSGRLGAHFCSASVVQSPGGDLAVTAAHCVTGKAGEIVFVPVYANGQTPYGVWPVARVYTDQAWQSSQDPDDDVAFLQLSAAADGVPVEDITGAEQLADSPQSPALVQVIGYPDGAAEPIACTNWTKIFSPTQLEFDCGGYTDGTSGGPFLADVSKGTGQGTVIGVIGGYEQGGLTPSVSYASVFGSAVTALYQDAEAGG